MSLKITRLEDPNILLEMNNAAVPDLNRIDEVKARWLMEHSVVPGLARLDEQVVGVIVVLSEQSDFKSDYFRWFTARYENFLYIDRVMVAGWARGRGVAKQLYEVVDAIAQERKLAVVADVYSQPPNTPSLNLHRVMGYAEIGAQHFPAEGRIAAKFMKFAEFAHPKA